MTLCCQLYYVARIARRRSLIPRLVGHPKGTRFNRINYPAMVLNQKYRQFVYETGAVDAGKGRVMDQGVVEKARQKGYKISRADRFRYRCRYFTDAGVIGGVTGH